MPLAPYLPYPSGTAELAQIRREALEKSRQLQAEAQALRAHSAALRARLHGHSIQRAPGEEQRQAAPGSHQRD